MMNNNKAQTETIETATMTIVVDAEEGTITCGNNVSKTEPLILNLLLYLREHSGVIVTRQQLMADVWKSQYTADTAINRGISALRKALGGNKGDFIKTLPKKGYRFVVPEGVVFVDVVSKPVDVIAETVMNKNSEVEKKPQPVDDNEATLLNLNDPKHPIEQVRLIRFATRLKGILLAGVLLVISLLCFFYYQPIKQDLSGSDKSTPTAFIDIERFTVATNDKNVSAMAARLESQIRNKVYSIKVKKPLAIHDGIKTKKGLLLRSKLNRFEGQVSLQLELFYQQQQELIYSTVINSDLDSLLKIEQFFTLEVVSILKLFIFNRRFAFDYLKALDSMNHQDIELLAQVRRYVDHGSDIGLAFSIKTLERLIIKYPNNAEVLGLKSLLWSKRLRFDDSDFVKMINQQIRYGKQALAIDPQNYDATISLFYLTLSSHRFDELSYYLNSLMRYHSHRMPTWRAQLYAMIIDAAPCGEIHSFVKTIPDGLFSQVRLKIIDQILDSCQQQMDLSGLITQLSHLPNSREDKAIHRSLFLFKRKHDKLLMSDEYYFNTRPSLSKISGSVVLRTVLDDSVGVSSMLSKLKERSKGYWLAQAQLFDYVYRGSSEVNGQVLDLIDQEFLSHGAEFLLVSYLTKLLSEGKTDTRYLEKYVQRRQEFSISVAKAQETTALIQAYYAIGDVQRSQSIAQRLYELTERYWLADQASFRFWYLGSSHLIAKYYCGEVCQSDDSPEQYLDKKFGENHPFWGDNLGFMTQALKPWQDDELAKLYLAKVKQSIVTYRAEQIATLE